MSFRTRLVATMVAVVVVALTVPAGADEITDPSPTQVGWTTLTGQVIDAECPTAGYYPVLTGKYNPDGYEYVCEPDGTTTVTVRTVTEVDDGTNLAPFSDMCPERSEVVAWVETTDGGHLVSYVCGYTQVNEKCYTGTYIDHIEYGDEDPYPAGDRVYLCGYLAVYMGECPLSDSSEPVTVIGYQHSSARYACPDQPSSDVLKPEPVVFKNTMRVVAPDPFTGVSVTHTITVIVWIDPYTGVPTVEVTGTSVTEDGDSVTVNMFSGTGHQDMTDADLSAKIQSSSDGMAHGVTMFENAAQMTATDPATGATVTYSLVVTVWINPYTGVPTVEVNGTPVTVNSFQGA